MEELEKVSWVVFGLTTVVVLLGYSLSKFYEYKKAERINGRRSS